MLIQIDISDLATIEEIHLVFSHGTTMITGETGAGKSVFIEAIDLALGGRASPSFIRPGKEKAEISLTFDITHFPDVIEHLKAHDLCNESECMIRRVITHDGRSRSYVNGIPQTLQFIKTLGECLFHLHGQHEQQVLLKQETQRDLLDRYGDHITLAKKIYDHAKSWAKSDDTIRALKNAQQDREKRMSYLAFQLNELEQLKLEANEWERIESEHRRHANMETLIQSLQNIADQLNGGDRINIMNQLHDMRKNLETIRTIEIKSKDWIEVIQSTTIQLDELFSDLNNYLENIEVDPEKCKNIEARMTEIHNLSRKYKTTPSQLLEIKKTLEDEYQSLIHGENNLQTLEQEQKNLENNYKQLAHELSHARMHAAHKFEKEITETIRSLSLPYGEFKIQFEKENHPFSYHGNEKIIFLIKTNPDQQLQPLNKVISGGELSRLSLAAHLALANRTSIPTLVFDEVDTGLGGATAEKIGRLLRQLGESYQVFCVTHQPQVAAYGHHHLLVEKVFIDHSTYTNLRLLTAKEKTHEIARLLGGEKVTQKTYAHAREILKMEDA